MGSESLHGSGGLVLAVDDEPMNLELVEEILSDAGFEVLTAGDANAALGLIARYHPDCIVLDIMMPQIDGFEVCARLKSGRETRFLPILMLTALTAVEDKVRSLELGADDFLSKPVIADELIARVGALVRIKRLRDELDTSESIILSMVHALESKVPPSAGHAERVAARAVRLGQRLDLPLTELELLGRAAMVHDIGKIGIPEELQEPSRPRSAVEQEIYRRHPIIGEQILEPLTTFAGARALVRHHHERLDGSGYPDGLVGDQLDLTTEVLAAANLFDNVLEQTGDVAAPHALLREAAARGELHPDLVEELLQLEREEPTLATGDLMSWQDLVTLPATARTGTILIGDPDPVSSDALATILRDAGHQVRTVATGNEVLRAVADLDAELVLLATDLAEADAMTVGRQLKEASRTRFLPVIMVAAEEEISSHFRAGAVQVADDFLRQPVNPLELCARIRSLLRLRHYHQDLEEYHNVLLTMAAVLEASDPYTRCHSERVGVLATWVAQELELDADLVSIMKVAGQLHDIGKLGIPKSLLNKVGTLTVEDMVVIRAHSVWGEEICLPLRSARRALPIIRSHHERFDGSGYPDRLQGEQIPIGARVLALADAYDALTSTRAYRKNLDPFQALSLLEQETDQGQWDPQVFAALTTVVHTHLQQ